MLRNTQKRLIGAVILVMSVSAAYFVLYTPQWIHRVSYLQGSNTVTYREQVDGTDDSLQKENTLHSSFLTQSQGSLNNHTTHQQDLVTVEETIYNRIDKPPEETDKLPFLKSFKNPCWREASGRNASRIRCLPYFYLIGPPKCGTTDLHRRLTQHPQISSLVIKEIQWIAKRRFGHPKYAKLSSYLQHFDRAVSSEIIPSGHNGYHSVIIGDFSPSTIWYTEGYWKSPSPKFTSNAEVIHHLNPGSKILVTLRNPVTRTYSDYKHFTRSASPNHFHSVVVHTIQEFDRRCKNTTNLKRCIDMFPNGVLKRMFIGIYSVRIEDYLRVFPRQQLFFTKVEERSNNMKSALKEIFSFLDIDPLPDKMVEDIVSQDIKAKNTHGVPDMLDKTKTLLEEFFKPFNERLGSLLGQEFNYNIHK